MLTMISPYGPRSTLNKMAFRYYNKNGRYWVKLYYMGREKKIEIDRGNLVDDHIKGPVEIEIFMYGR